MTRPSQTSQSGGKVLDVLAALLGHFAHGLTPGDIAKATGLDPSAVTRYIATLEAKGFAARIVETGRIRPSTQLASHAIAILRSLDVERARLENLQTRLLTTQE
ncbi:MAG: MarR family transcriptional regulator [Betaproteobacteria bacterium]|nr:MarR family transcriptional regulator [Betaproteobacteria bacterium]MCL2886525.1 MarR family transcriptional regulator [Betaproteobacteria bacterium]